MTEKEIEAGDNILQELATSDDSEEIFALAEAKGAITPADAALVREAGVIALKPEAAPVLPEITVTSSK